MTDKEIEVALNQCAFSTDKYTRCKGCPYNDGSLCITNLHLDTLKYIERLKAIQQSVVMHAKELKEKGELSEAAIEQFVIDWQKGVKDDIDEKD